MNSDRTIGMVSHYANDTLILQINATQHMFKIMFVKMQKKCRFKLRDAQQSIPATSHAHIYCIHNSLLVYAFNALCRERRGENKMGN